MPRNNFLLCLIILTSLFFLSACEGDVASLDEDAYGSLDTAAIAVSVEWPDEAGTAEDCNVAGIVGEEDAYGARMSAAPITLSDNCTSRGVDKVRVEVQNSSGATLKSATFECSDRQGTLAGIEQQAGCSIVVSGLNSAGTARYRGSKTNVTLHAGMNNVGVIKVEPLYTTQYTVTASTGKGGSVTPSSRSVSSGSTASFTVSANSDYTRNPRVGGTCPAGSWSGNNYNTGPVISNCIVSFSFILTSDYTNSIGITFNHIKPGTFIMGSPVGEPGRYDEPGTGNDETQHQVTLTQGYYMQTTEVTQGQWKAVMGGNPSYFSNCGDDCPVEDVSWDDIQKFIKALNRREASTGYALPTEAQWEYAARAGSTTAFANGQITHTGNGYDPVLDSMGWYVYNSGDRTHPVAQKAPNAWGLYDMHGNVWEWVADWYGKYPSSSVTNPTGPTSGTSRVLRGGSWGNYALSSRSANRESYNSSFTAAGSGLCCSQVINPGSRQRRKSIRVCSRVADSEHE
jgi:formylglycine-generating enzyme required for sulfatase activity